MTCTVLGVKMYKIMENIFLINPEAGSRNRIQSIVDRIRKACSETGMDAEICFTNTVDECRKYIAGKCMDNPGEKIRFFGCGGDGTLNHVVNACVPFENAVAGNVPVGTGNDFVRTIGSLSDFSDISRQLRGIPVHIDLIRCEYIEDGVRKVCYCDNMINIGFDSNVVEKAAQIRKGGIVTGSLAYLMGVAVILAEKKGADLLIEFDGETVHDGPLLLTAVANGSYCGGGVRSSPRSKLNDGTAEASIIRDVSRRKFVKLYPSYSKGTHLDIPHIDEIIDYRPVKTVHIRTNGETMRVSNDGEIIYTDEIWLEVEPKRILFSVPEGLL